MRRNVLQTPKLMELKRRRRLIFLRRALLALVGIAAVLGALAYLSRLSGINIEEVRVEGESIVSEDDIRETAERELSGAYAWLLPKTNVLFFPKTGIAQALATEYPRLADIKLEVKNDRALRITVTEREPRFLWCGSPHDDACFFMDDTGYIFDAAPYFSGNAYFRWSGTRGVDPSAPVGSRFLPEEFGRLVLFRDLVSDLGLEPVAYDITSDGDAELVLRRTGPEEPRIILRPGDDMPHLAENLAAALETEPLKTRMKKEYSKLEYLDLRFDNKVYSKFATQ